MTRAMDFETGRFMWDRYATWAAEEATTRNNNIRSAQATLQKAGVEQGSARWTNQMQGIEDTFESAMDELRSGATYNMLTSEYEYMSNIASKGPFNTDLSFLTPDQTLESFFSSSRHYSDLPGTAAYNKAVTERDTLDGVFAGTETKIGPLGNVEEPVGPLGEAPVSAAGSAITSSTIDGKPSNTGAVEEPTPLFGVEDDFFVNPWLGA